MPTFYSRLALVGGPVLALEARWFENDEHPVGLIRERPETVVQVDSEEDEDEAIEKTPAHFEVWLLPKVLYEQVWKFYSNIYTLLFQNPGQAEKIWEKAEEAIGAWVEAHGDEKVVCRRVFLDQVAFTEEKMTFGEAHPVIHDFFADKIVDVPEGPKEPQPDKLPVPEKSPALATSNQGESQSAAS